MILTDHQAAKSKKSKKRNKKGKTDRPLANGEDKDTNGVKPDLEAEEDGEAEEDDSGPPTEPPTPSIHSKSPFIPINGTNGDAHEKVQDNRSSHSRRQSRSQPSASTEPAKDATSGEHSNGAPDARLDALTKEREDLLNEVSEVRRTLEEFQKRHNAEISQLQEQLSQTETERDEKGGQYQSLLGKVNTIKSQLGERLKADAVSGRRMPFLSFLTI